MNRRNFFTKIAGTFVAGVAIALGASRREGFKRVDHVAIEAYTDDPALAESLVPKIPKGWFIANYKFAPKDYTGPAEFIVVHRKGFSHHA